MAPELKAHSAKLDGLQRQQDTLQRQQETLQKSIEMQHDSMIKTIDAFRAEMRSEFASLRMNNQMEVMRQVSPISERIAIVESRTKKG